jgi:hypothetical protein
MLRYSTINPKILTHQFFRTFDRETVYVGIETLGSWSVAIFLDSFLIATTLSPA